MEIRPMKDELVHVEKQTDGPIDIQTDMTKLIVSLSNFENLNKNPAEGRICT